MLSSNPIRTCFFALAAVLVNDVSAQAGVSTCGRRVAPLSGVKCGARGTVARPQVIIDIIAAVPETQQQLLRDCQDACLDRGRVCKAWFINPKTNRCRLFSATIESMGFTADSNANSPLFYSKDCVDGECYTTYDTKLTSDARTYDDDTFQVCPPGGLKFYGTSYNCAYMSVNGVLSFGNNAASNTAYFNDPIPTTRLPPTSLAVFWDDLYLDAQSTRIFPDHSLSWSQDRLGDQRKTTFTWKAKIPSASTTDKDMWVWIDAVFTRNSNIVLVKFTHLANTGAQGATIGAQNYDGRSMQVLYNQYELNSGNYVTFDTGSNTYNLCESPSGC